METIKQFKSSNGQIFETKKACVAYEREIESRKKMEQFIKNLGIDFDSDDIVNEVASQIIGNFTEISAILNPSKPGRKAKHDEV